MSAADRGGQHAPVTVLNRAGDGIRTFTGCVCGEGRPKTPPQSMRTSSTAYLAHLRKLGIRRPDNLAHAVYIEGPATGMTWDEWYAETKDGPDRDPFGIR